jgi:protein tyrosine/serine phosphatase
MLKFLKKYKKLTRTILFVLILAALVFVKSYVYDYKLNYNFEAITEGKVYKSGVIPPDKIEEYVKKYHIKSIIDLRFPGTNDLINNPENPKELTAEKIAASKIKGLQHFTVGSDQIPKQKNIDDFLKIMDNSANYPVLIHCFHGVGRAQLYSAIYRIEYENWDNDKARKHTRFITIFSTFDIGKPKGDFLHNYKKRKK